MIFPHIAYAYQNKTEILQLFRLEFGLYSSEEYLLLYCPILQTNYHLPMLQMKGHNFFSQDNLDTYVYFHGNHKWRPQLKKHTLD